MFKENVCKASLTWVLVMQSCLVSLAISSSNITDQLALLAFKSEIVYDPNSVLAGNWTENTNFCDWYGVSCSLRRQRVTGLRLESLGLQGTISPHIGNLSFLVELNLRNNSFHGPLTPEISRLRRLEILRLPINMLEGNIPLGIHQCRKLRVISLGTNRFTGVIPHELSSLPLLRLLVQINNLTGTIPPSFGNISSLQILSMAFNNLSGSIPTELAQLSNLQELYLNKNHLSGLIPPELFNISSLQEIWLTSNYLSGNLPPTTGLSLPNLDTLVLQANQLSGNIPSHLSNSSKLTILVLAMNNFTGEVPKSLGQLKSISTIVLAINQLTGQIPQEIGFMKNLNQLDLRFNDLNGVIPSTIGGMTTLQRLYLDWNTIEGTIPNEICLLRNLGEIGLHDNKLYGSVPNCIGNLSSLQRIRLSSNAFRSIPSTLWNLENLLSLNLESNSISGSLDPNLRVLKVLGSMDLSGNQILGNIPSTIGAFESLTYLNLSGNSFSGPIPESMSDLVQLNILDLSRNNLSGAIPKSLNEISHLEYLNMSFNKLTGEIPSGGPFENFTAQSFMGNEALCGNATLQVPPCTSHTSKNSRTKDIVLKYLLPAAFAFVVISVSIFFILTRYQRTHVSSPESVDLLPTGEYRRISYHELRLATNEFCEANLVGVGSFGSVYKGILSDGTNVAVKVLNLQLEGAYKSFDSECNVLRTARHRNLVKIISTCSHHELRALVLQYMSNGSLEKWLYSSDISFDLFQRVSIMLDVALAVEYLHYGQEEQVVHCDLKPSNVLLDEDMVAHVADFGIAKILAQDKTATQTKTLGTLGYIAPEYGYEGKVSRKGDMYSFGIMLLETFTKKKPTDDIFTGELSLRQWVSSSLPHRIMEVADKGLTRKEDGEDMITTKGTILALMELGLECSKGQPEERSNIKEVVIKLSKIRSQLICNRGG